MFFCYFFHTFLNLVDVFLHFFYILGDIFHIFCDFLNVLRNLFHIFLNLIDIFFNIRKRTSLMVYTHLNKNRQINCFKGYNRGEHKKYAL